MKIHFITTAAPPVINGIGDYTARLILALRAQETSLEISVSAPAHTNPYDNIGDIPVQTPFQSDNPLTNNALTEIFRREKPDWIFLQYQPFSYGRWGFNPILPAVVDQARKYLPQVRLATMFHEVSVPKPERLSPKTLKQTAFHTWQTDQALRLLRSSDISFFSTERWGKDYARQFPNKNIQQLAVGSAIPLVPVPGGKAAARHRLGIGDEFTVIGIFGTAHSSRQNFLIEEAVQAVRNKGEKPFVLYIGSEPALYADVVPKDVPSLLDGPFPPDEVSRRLQAIDILLALYVDGVAARRTGFITALQHSLPVLGIIGRNTDSWLAAAEGAFQPVPFREHPPYIEIPDASLPERFRSGIEQLVGDKALRESMGQKAYALFEERFLWEKIAGQVLREFNTPK